MRITYFPLSRRSPREPAHLELAHAHVVTLADSQVSGDPHMPVWRRHIAALRPQRDCRHPQLAFFNPYPGTEECGNADGGQDENEAANDDADDGAGARRRHLTAQMAAACSPRPP